MKSLLVCSLSLLVGSGAAIAAPERSYEDNLFETCAIAAHVAEAVISDRTSNGVAAEVRDHPEYSAKWLSESLPQSYNAIHTVLISALELNTLPSPVSSADRAAVLGLWCVQDTRNKAIGGSRPSMLDPDTQTDLVYIYSEMITGSTP